MSLELPETKAEKVKTGLMKANVFHGPGNFGIVLKPIPGLRVSEHFGATCTCLLPKTRPAQFAPKLAGAVWVWPLKLLEYRRLSRMPSVLSNRAEFSRVSVSIPAISESFSMLLGLAWLISYCHDAVPWGQRANAPSSDLSKPAESILSSCWWPLEQSPSHHNPIFQSLCPAES